MVIPLRVLRNKNAQVIFITFILFGMFALEHTAYAASFFEQFIDPHDGKFDAGDWLLDKKGFLPIPIIVTEPAVGYGAGVALLFFHAKNDEQFLKEAAMRLKENKKAKKPSLPPSISALLTCVVSLLCATREKMSWSPSLKPGGI